MADLQDDGRDDLMDERQRFFISRCGHGGVHLGFGRVVVTLDAEEVDTVWRLMERARITFAETAAPASADVTH